VKTEKGRATWKKKIRNCHSEKKIPCIIVPGTLRANPNPLHRTVIIKRQDRVLMHNKKLEIVLLEEILSLINDHGPNTFPTKTIINARTR